jgi:hypothetical protein
MIESRRRADAQAGGLRRVRFGEIRRWRWLVLPALAVCVMLALESLGARPRAGFHSTLGAILGRVVRHGGNPGSRSRRALWDITVGSGATIRRFGVSEPAGVIELLRGTVPDGTRAQLTGVIPHYAGVGIGTPRSGGSPETCRLQGAVDVCTEPLEACPCPTRCGGSRCTSSRVRRGRSGSSSWSGDRREGAYDGRGNEPLGASSGAELVASTNLLRTAIRSALFG